MLLEKQSGTWQDEEDSWNEGQYGAVGADMSDIIEHKSNEHEEKADQWEGSGWANHFCNNIKKKHYSFIHFL